MKHSENLIRASGLINALFFAFHLWLGWRLHHFAHIQPTVRALLEIFNGCGSLSILFLAIAGLSFAEEAATTKIGQLTLSLGAAFYLTRAALEFLLSPAPSPLIAAICIATGGVYVVAIAFIRSARLQENVC
ncbi:MAG: hypothetical protein QM790_09730 [Nibricoccus sp.]